MGKPGGVSIGRGGGHAQAGNVLKAGPATECLEMLERVERGRMQAASGVRVRKGACQTDGEQPKTQRQMSPATPAEHAAETRRRGGAERNPKRIVVRRPGVGSNAGPHFRFGTLRQCGTEACLRWACRIG